MSTADPNDVSLEIIRDTDSNSIDLLNNKSETVVDSSFAAYVVGAVFFVPACIFSNTDC